MNYQFDPDKKQEILITCLPGLSEVLVDEVEKLGFQARKGHLTSVTCQGTFHDTYKLNYWLRTASHVHYKLATFKARNANDLYREASLISWEKLMDDTGYFSIHSFVKNDSIRDFRFANLKLKDAIADRFQKKVGRRPDSGPDNSRTVIYLHWHREQVSIYLDTSGITLSKRGYRLEGWKAPLAESLAAGLILSTGWDGKSNFVNPMGGSGTLCIEAALIAMNLPPARLRRNFGFKHVKGFDASQWEKVRKSPEPKPLDFKILFNDNKRRAAQIAEKNMKEAGVAEAIEIMIGDFNKIEVPEGGGVVLLNPPYGERIGDVTQLKDDYARIGDFFKQKCVNYRGYILTANKDLAKNIGLRPDRKMTFYNAKLEAKFLEYSIYEGSKKVKNNK